MALFSCWVKSLDSTLPADNAKLTHSHWQTPATAADGACMPATLQQHGSWATAMAGERGVGSAVVHIPGSCIMLHVAPGLTEGEGVQGGSWAVTMEQ